MYHRRALALVANLALAWDTRPLRYRSSSRDFLVDNDLILVHIRQTLVGCEGVAPSTASIINDCHTRASWAIRCSLAVGTLFLASLRGNSGPTIATTGRDMRIWLACTPSVSCLVVMEDRRHTQARMGNWWRLCYLRRWCRMQCRCFALRCCLLVLAGAAATTTASCQRFLSCCLWEKCRRHNWIQTAHLFSAARRHLILAHKAFGLWLAPRWTRTFEALTRSPNWICGWGW